MAIATDDGWGGERPWDQWPLPAAPLGSYMTVLSAMVRRGFVPIIVAYLGCSALGVLVQTPNWLNQGLNAYALANPGNEWAIITGGAIALLALPITLLYTVFFTPVILSIYRIARLAVLAPDEIPTLGSALRQLGRRYGATLGFFVIQFLLVLAGSCLLILPGLAVALILLPGTYLVVNGVPFSDSFLASIRLVAANWLMLLVYVAIAVVLGLLWFGCAFGIVFGASASVGAWGQLAGSMVVALIGFVVGIPLFFFGAALMVAMEAGSYGIEVQVDPELEGGADVF